MSVELRASIEHEPDASTSCVLTRCGTFEAVPLFPADLGPSVGEACRNYVTSSEARGKVRRSGALCKHNKYIAFSAYIPSRAPSHSEDPL